VKSKQNPGNPKKINIKIIESGKQKTVFVWIVDPKVQNR
jgi:hypothetical protein